jgi:hypothetical protein
MPERVEAMDLSLEMPRDSFRHVGLLGGVTPTVEDLLKKRADRLNPPDPISTLS